MHVSMVPEKSCSWDYLQGPILALWTCRRGKVACSSRPLTTIGEVLADSLVYWAVMWGISPGKFEHELWSHRGGDMSKQDSWLCPCRGHLVWELGLQGCAFVPQLPGRVDAHVACWAQPFWCHSLALQPRSIFSDPAIKQCFPECQPWGVPWALGSALSSGSICAEPAPSKTAAFCCLVLTSAVTRQLWWQTVTLHWFPPIFPGTSSEWKGISNYVLLYIFFSFPIKTVFSN